MGAALRLMRGDHVTVAPLPEPAGNSQTLAGQNGAVGFDPVQGEHLPVNQPDMLLIGANQQLIARRDLN